MDLVCITGMHRSGTSLVASLLGDLGLWLGDPQQLQPPGPDNPSGYWENRYVIELNDEILAHLGGSWDQPPVLVDGWERAPDLDQFRARAAAVVHSAYRDADGPSTAGWKDPRLAVLLPFWRTVVSVPATVVVTRHPAEVAASLHRRNGIDVATASLLWLRYVLAATVAAPDALVIDHATLLRDPVSTLAGLSAHVGLDPPGAEALAAATQRIDDSLRHHVAGRDGNRPADNPNLALAEAVWGDGHLDPGLLHPHVIDAVRNGWLRPPSDSDELVRARARVVELTEQIRRRNRARRSGGSPSNVPAGTRGNPSP